MAHPEHQVEQGILTLRAADGERRIVVGTPDWFRWVETATTFTVVSAQGTYTARRERAGSGGEWCWRAYHDGASGHERAADLGLTAELSLERLEAITAQLAAQALPRQRPSRRAITAPVVRAQHQDGAERAPEPTLLTTKLYAPRTRADLVTRPRLHQRLDTGLHGALTLVCAPAGFGKSTLVAEWLRQAGYRSAWLSLDAADSDPAGFLRYMVAALQQVAPEVGATIRSLLQLAQPPPLETLLAMLINDLAEISEKSILVLDDYHVLRESSIHQALSFFIEHLPPTLHLVIVTREDPQLPLARLRARRQVVDVRAEHLRFTADEATVFLTQSMGLVLNPSDMAALESRTEGWIAGLQLAALVMQDRDDHAGFIAALAGSNRYIVDYLTDEVLTNQPPQIQRFLLQTSILERMCGPLCDAVVTDEGGRMKDEDRGPGFIRHPSSLILAQLERANLFVVPLDAERRWYRYHHLFAEVLRERLRRGTPALTVAALHQQASTWYAHSGLIPEAIQHAFAAELPDTAAQLIEAHGPQLIAQGEIKSLLRWLRQLPDSTLRGRPRLLVLLCWLLPNTGALDDVARYRAEAEALLAESADAALRSEFLALQLQPLVFQDRTDEVIAIGTQVLAHLPADHFFRSISGVMTGLALLRQSRLVEAERTLSSAVTEAYARQALYFVVSGLTRLGMVAAERGDFALAAQRYEEAIAACRGTHGALSPIAGMALVGLGRLRGLQGRVDDGIQLLEQALTLCAQLNAAPFFFLDGHTGLADLYATSGRIPDALQQLALAEERLRPFPNAVFVDAIAAHRAAIWRAAGDPAFLTWLHERRQPVDVRQAGVRDKEYLTHIRGLIDTGQSVAALELIDRLAAFARAMGRVRGEVDLHVLRAVALRHQGDAQAAQAAIDSALALAAPMGYLSIFLEEGAPMAAPLARMKPSTWLRPGAEGGRMKEYLSALLAASGRQKAGHSSSLIR